MEHAVAFMAGVSYLVLGPSMMIRWQDWSHWLRHMRERGRTAALMIGAWHLAIGSFIVGFHWQWEGMRMLLTVLGAKAIFEGFVYTLFPSTTLALLKWLEPYHRVLLPLSGLIVFLLSPLFLCEWQQAVFPALDWHPYTWVTHL